MKKIYTLTLAIMSVILVVGQSSHNKNANIQLNQDYKEPFRSNISKHHSNSRETLDEELINFSYALTLATDSLPLNGWVYLFPDTMARITSGSTDYSFYRFTDRYHSAGDVLDLSSNVFNSISSNAFDSTKSYHVDSAYVEYYYNRNISNAIDTIRIYVSVEDGSDFVEGSNAEPYPILKYDPLTNAPSTYVKTIDILLNESDTAWNDSKFLELKIDLDLDANQLMSLVIDYIPGYEYTNTSNYFFDLNPFVLSCTKERKSKQSHMVSLGMDEVLTFNQGIFSDFYQVYAKNLGSYEFWNTQYANVYANEYWTKYDGVNINTRYNHLDIWYVISSIEEETTSLEEIKEEEIKLFPNPATKLLTVQVASTNTAIQIFDMLGTLVYINDTPSSSNKINLESFSKGFYTVVVGTSTKKLVIE